MDVSHIDDELERLENDPEAGSAWPANIVRKFRSRMVVIRNAVDERDIFNIIGPKNFYKLSEDRSHQHALRLNDQFRLVVEFKKGDRGKTVEVVEIVDYHKG